MSLRKIKPELWFTAVWLAAIPALSQARSIVVYEEPLKGAGDWVAAQLNYNSANTEASWAWVDVTTSSTSSERRVPGLQYDFRGHQIVYKAADSTEAAPVVCAKITETGFLFFSKKKTVMTGNCQLKTSVEGKTGKVVLEVP